MSNSQTTRSGHVDWGAIAAGVIVTLGLELMLLFLGTSTQMTSMEVYEGLAPVTAKNYGYTLAAMAVSQLVGAYCAVRLADAHSKTMAALLGFTTWALNSLVTILLSNAASPAIRILAGISWFAYFVSWWAFFISFFGAIAGVAGGILGTFRRKRDVHHIRRTPQEPDIERRIA